MIKNPSFRDDHLYHPLPPAKGAARLILLVDDDPNLCTTLERFMRYAGLDCVATESGLRALALLHLRTPDLIILDLDMPGLDGMSLLRSIRQDASFVHIPILIHTADFSRLKEQEAAQAGAQAYIVKGTMGWERFLERVRELLDNSDPPLRLAR